METWKLYAASAGIGGSLSAIFGKISFENGYNGFVTIFGVIAFAIANVIMWACYTKSLSMASSTSEPMLINMSVNFAVTGALGYLIFDEFHSTLWWFFLATLIFGLALILIDIKPKEKST